MAAQWPGRGWSTSQGLANSGGMKQTLLILGASGDLTSRLLLPGLGGLLTRGRVGGLSLIGSSRHDWDDHRWRQLVAEAFAAGNASGAQADAVVAGARYLQADVTTEGDLRRLLGACQGCVVIYFALPPPVTVRACQALTRIELPEGTRLVLEKPFGTDASSAEALNDLLARLVPEDSVHRVDHYLGKSTVLNIVGLKSRDFRDCKAQVLRATRVWGDHPAVSSRRARYTAGGIAGRRVPSYVDEEGIDPVRNTETLAEVVLAVDTWRWAGVPFRVRAGKALSAMRKEAMITFKQPPWVPTGLIGYDRPDRLRIGFNPDCLGLDMNINGPGDPLVVDPITMKADFGLVIYRRTGRFLTEYLRVTRRYRCVGTPPWSAGASSSRYSRHGAITRCPCRNTRPAVPDLMTEPDD